MNSHQNHNLPFTFIRFTVNKLLSINVFIVFCRRIYVYELLIRSDLPQVSHSCYCSLFYILYEQNDGLAWVVSCKTPINTYPVTVGGIEVSIDMQVYV